VRDLIKFQQELHDILRKHPHLKVATEYPWDPTQFESIIWILQDYVNGLYGDFDTDELADWLDRYSFYKTGNRPS
jgi:hypothetical protein